MRTTLSIAFITAAFCAAVALPSVATAAGQQNAVSPDTGLAADQAKPPQAPGTQKPVPQTTKPKPPPAPKLKIGFRVFGAYETTLMSAKESFKAQTGSSMVPGYAVGADILNLWKKVFLRIGMSNGSADGTRGFVDENDRFISNGVPLKVGVRNIEFGVGWRTYMNRRMALYVGAGVTKTTHSQESPDAEPGDNDSQDGSGYMGLFGLEFALNKDTVARPAKRQFILGLEAQVRSVAEVLGESGSSLAYGEDNLGGVAVRALFGIRFRR